MTVSWKRLLTAAVVAVVFVVPRIANANVIYAGGSLIIPMQSSFQSDCGVASAYGLVFDILRANAWLAANGYNRVTIHWAYSSTKNSPNRCVPTNLSVPPVYGTYTNSNKPPWNDRNWNDGCDFQVIDSTSVPVTQINYSNTATTGDTTISSINTTTGTASTSPVYPEYAAVTVQHTTSTSTNVTTVQYEGGPFVISASDAPTVLGLLNGSIVANDIYGNAISFSQFTTGSGKCTASNFDSGGNHYVTIHRAQTSFSAQDNFDMNATPPRMALLATGSNVSDGILEPYLTSAGLTFSGAAGCPVNGANVKTRSECPNGSTSGQIYDLFDVSDFANNLEFNTDASGNNVYGVVWTPHWQAGNPPSTSETNAANSISSFLDTETGLFAECASIATYEGAVQSEYACNYYGDGSCGCGSFLQPSCSSSTAQSTYISANQGSNISQLQTCVQSSTTSGTCSGSSTTSYGLNQVISPASTYDVFLPNCTDPTHTSGEQCEYFPVPGDSFMQIGDYEWYDSYGYTQNYLPNTQNSANVIYQPGVIRLAYNILSLNTSNLTNGTTALTMDSSDEVTRNVKNNSPVKGNVVYFAGHTYDNYLAGTRVVLGTLLQLGLVYSSEETGYSGPTYYNGSVYVPTYDRVTSTPTNGAVKTLNPLEGSMFLFPFHTGHVKAHLLTSLSTGNNAYSSNVEWNAQTAMPAPHNRNVFTYLGGSVSAPSTSLARQSGWTPVNFDTTSIQSPVSTCVDSFGVGKIAANTTTSKPGPYLGMTSGADGVCDLEETLAQGLVLTQSNFGTDYGSSEWTTNKSTLLSTANGGAVQSIQGLIQQVRGFCNATSTGQDGTGSLIIQPTSTQCNYREQDNIATIGGIVHSQIAIVPASTYVSDAPSGKHRPTVAYTGGLDGQLHAFYVPSDGNDTGYTGPASTLHYPFTAANASAFNNNYMSSGKFTAPTNALTELWSFIPPGQLPMLYSNNAMVDSAPAVLDVFGDFGNTGIREWHTVLVASAGGQNREIFALDVTNPLAPVMLWDIESSIDSSIFYAPVALDDDNTGQYNVNGQTTLPDEQAFGWNNHCTAESYTLGTCVASLFVLPPLTDNSVTSGGVTYPARYTSGLYNYQNLGASQSVSAGMLRRNNSPVFAAFVATNAPGGEGMYTFAIDIPTGEKIWEFNNPYDKASDSAAMASALDNTPPTGVTLWSKEKSSLLDTAFVGDLEGSLWQLDLTDGLNETSYYDALSTSTIASSCTKEGSCNFPLVQAFGYDPNGYPQPITTESTIFTVPTDVAKTSPFYNYMGSPLLAFGTAGTDDVSSLSPPVTGSVDVLPLTGNNELTLAQVIGPTSQYTTAVAKGLGIMVTGYPEYVTTGERLYGSITAAGDHLYFATTSGTVTSIDSRGALGGSTYAIDLTAAYASSLTTLTSSAGGAAGTVLVAPASTSGQVQIITVTDQQINVSSPQSPNLTAQGVNGEGQTPSAFLGWFFRTTGDEF